MKAWSVIRNTAPLILKLAPRWRWVFIPKPPATLLPGKESFCDIGTEFLNVVYMNFSYKIQFVITEGWNVTGLRPDMRNYYHHKMSLWLNLIHLLHRPGGDDLNMRHHHFLCGWDLLRDTLCHFFAVNTTKFIAFLVYNVHWNFSWRIVWKTYLLIILERQIYMGLLNKMLV
jgi:hypothetical protein